jgi:hypothetical protein
MRSWLMALSMVLALAGTAFAQEARLATGEPMRAWPGADYDPAVPTLDAVVGHAIGTEITSHSDMLRYLQALQAAAPDRMRLQTIGQSWQGRDLVLAIITSPRNQARLDAVKEGMQRLGDPRRTDRAAADALIGDLPAPVWLAYAVHGDETSGTDAALYTAYHLLAARGDTRVAQMLEESVVILYPLQNPDGRERFIASTISARGSLEADSDPESAERDQPWPGGRSNHYLFNLNRDWFAQTQPETRAQTRAMLEWLPVAVADIHEMSTDETYFFPPPAQPINPYQTPAQMRFREAIGRTNATWFDRFGIDYFTRDTYDLFYPGYGDTWPSYFGSAAMTYEQGAARGLRARRSNGESFTYADAVWNQAVASLATIETAARERARWLGELYTYHQTAIAEGRRARGGRYALIPTQNDQAGADRLARLLASQRVEVSRAEAGFSACGDRYEAGAYIIDLAQPASRLARVLLDQDVPIGRDFMAEQERRRARGLGDEFYDVTGWSVPLAMNLSVARCGSASRTQLTPVDPASIPAGRVENPDAAVAFIVPWGDRNAVAFLTAAMRARFIVRSADESFTIAGRRWPAGSLILPRAGAPEDMSARLAALAAQTGVTVTGVDDSWVTEGPSFGSSETPRMRAPRVALLWDRPTYASSAGATRFVLERDFGVPVTVVRGSAFADRSLDRFDVVILPDGGDYGAVLGESAAADIKGWVERGGVLIGLGGAVRYLSDPENDLMALRREDAYREGAEDAEESEEEDAPTTVPGTRLADEAAYRTAIEETSGPPDSIAGALVRARVDGEHWLGAGAAPAVNVLYEGTDMYAPLRLDQGANVARFEAPGSVLASGAMWPENRDQLAFKPFVAIEEQGAGYVIAFTADPTTRALMDGLEVLFANAVFRASAKATPSD